MTTSQNPFNDFHDGDMEPEQTEVNVEKPEHSEQTEVEDVGCYYDLPDIPLNIQLTDN